jgi:hypothetical protein
MSDPKKFWSCGQEKMIFFTASTIVGCCANLKTGGTPHLGNYGPGGVIDIGRTCQCQTIAFGYCAARGNSSGMRRLPILGTPRPSERYPILVQ